ncbi:hypothetical protein AB0C18_18290 [Nonomuraea muscovyensis]|uniref:hypothetical protein n=1 Tax=Nonomuraea muscovyensis TaxID=1124761 RepID=UPI003405D120
MEEIGKLATVRALGQRLDPAVALLGGAGPVPGQRGLGCLDSVDRVGLAGEAAGLAVRPVDLDHVDVLVVRQLGQAGPVPPGTSASGSTSAGQGKPRPKPSSLAGMSCGRGLFTAAVSRCRPS